MNVPKAKRKYTKRNPKPSTQDKENSDLIQNEAPARKRGRPSKAT